MAQVVEAHDGRQLAVKSLGDPVGRPVFLLHGTPGTLDGPLPRGIFLYRLGIRLISYTRPGYPGSDRHEKAGPSPTRPPMSRPLPTNWGLADLAS